jgi:type II secretory pathway predicted ATPase ExeA
MYESFYGLRKRPFAAAPDADVMVETPAVADVVARIDRCVRHGRGVAVMTAAAGLGKTQLCHHFLRRFGNDYHVALLPNASFPARRGFLQAILAELDQPFQKLGETELRLELTSVAKAASSNSNGVVLILDEAHRYSDKLLDEVRIVANLIENGEPLIRVILAGHVELEDRLAEPGLSGLNERVGELVSLMKLTAEESRAYLQERTSFAGGTLETLFDEASVALLMRACGGVPRCLNQLADHSLLLGYVAERRPVDESLVREALDDLKRLPLQWHDPLPENETDVVRLRSTDVASGSEATDNVIEIGGLIDDEFETSPGLGTCIEFDPDSHQRFEEDSTLPAAPPAPQARTAERPAMEPVLDRFARIDAAERKRQWFETLECSASPRTPTSRDLEPIPAELYEVESYEEEQLESPAASVATAAPEPRPASNPLTTLDRIVPLLAELEADFGVTATRDSVARRVDGGTPRVSDARSELERLVAALGNTVIPPGSESRGMNPTNGLPRPIAKSGTRSTLFSDLRRKQLDASSD